MLRRPIVIIGIVLVLIVFGIIIFKIDWGGSGTEQNSNQEEKQKSLVDYSDTDVKVRFTNSGEINSNREHREVQITVGRDNVDAKIISGYQGNVSASQQFGNNPGAYKAFLAALEMLGFTKTKESAPGATEEGSCPNRQRYVFEIFDSNETIHHSWSTSCTAKLGTFAGEVSQTTNLFEAQVPDYNKFVSGVHL